MKLTYHEADPQVEADSVLDRYPHGYWYAVTDDGGWDADGPDPLTTVSRLALIIESELAELRTTRSLAAPQPQETP